MTCIVALVERGVVWMGGDSGSFGSYDVRVKPDGKVFQNGEFLIGASGEMRQIDLLRYAFVPPPIPDDTDLMHYMVMSFVNGLRQCYSEAGLTQRDNGQEKACGTCLVGVRGHLFCVWKDFCVTDYLTPYDAIGAGGDFAIGVLYATKGWEPQRRIHLALEAAQEHCTIVRGPFKIRHLAEPLTEITTFGDAEPRYIRTGVNGIERRQE